MSRIPVPSHHSPAQPSSYSSYPQDSPAMSSRPQSSRSAYSQSGSSYLSTNSTVPSTPPASSDGLAETRKRQSKRDEVSHNVFHDARVNSSLSVAGTSLNCAVDATALRSAGHDRDRLACDRAGIRTASAALTRCLGKAPSALHQPAIEIAALTKVSFCTQAIRKKIEGELSRKRPGSKRAGTSGPAGGSSSSGNHRSARPKQGTVSALRPLPALTVPHGMSVSDASQLCAAKRTDCVLVVDEDEHLCGIFTAKDLAFRVRCRCVAHTTHTRDSRFCFDRSSETAWTRGPRPSAPS